MATTSRGKTRPITVALQGGGAHGAFTWGVLDALLADERIEIEGLSGSSAGAINAVVVADGIMADGREGAREALRRFWRAVRQAAAASPLQRSAIDVYLGNWSLDNSPGYLFLDLLSRVASPYDLNPLNLNPLKVLLERTVDFERVRLCDRMKIYVAATNVETGRVRVFERHELTPDAVLASACVPHLFQAVQIEGVPYWDGGYMGNPVLFPFFRGCHSDDLVIVQINPLERKGTPRSAREVLDRMNEITFNASLMKELRAIEFVQRLLDEGRLDEERYSHVRVHIIAADDALEPLGASSKMNAEWAFLSHLFEVGRTRALSWLDSHYADLGRRSTVDLSAMF